MMTSDKASAMIWLLFGGKDADKRNETNHHPSATTILDVHAEMVGAIG